MLPKDVSDGNSIRRSIFVFPIKYEGSYLFRVHSIPAAEGYLRGFFQDGVMVWENYRDEGMLSGIEYGIHPSMLAHAKFVPGPVEVWVRASINGQWTDAAVTRSTSAPRAVLRAHVILPHYALSLPAQSTAARE